MKITVNSKNTNSINVTVKTPQAEVTVTVGKENRISLTTTDKVLLSIAVIAVGAALIISNSI